MSDKTIREELEELAELGVELGTHQAMGQDMCEQQDLDDFKEKLIQKYEGMETKISKVIDDLECYGIRENNHKGTVSQRSIYDLLK